MRADEFLFINGFFDSRTKAKQAIGDGNVFIDGEILTKPSKEITGKEKITLKETESFVSLGGYKLAKALDDFRFDVNGLTVADIGASTGGFTDCLLKRGAKKVYAVDLNDDLLHTSLKFDDRVIMIVKNAKDLSACDFEKVDLLTADLSFISAKSVLQVFYGLVKDGGNIILLIKPQFEIGEKRKFKNGIIKDGTIRKNVCRSVYDCAVEIGFLPLKMTTAPIKEDKNVEYLFLLGKNTGKAQNFEQLFIF